MQWFELFGFLPFGWLDLLDILLVAFLLFKLYELVRGTVAIRVFFGVLAFYVLWLIVTALKMHMMSEIFRQVINVGVIALIIVFQQEIRKFLVAVGNSGLFRKMGGQDGLFGWLNKEEEIPTTNVDVLTESVFAHSDTKTGLLIVIECQADLQVMVDSGRSFSAELSQPVIESIFYKNSPLHDGAVIVRGNTIVAASCTLPLTARPRVPSGFGMRHKAACGVTEEFDAIAILVSEETGEVAIAHEGELRSYKTRPAFKTRLNELLG